jgi:hypothetical protein
MIIRSVGSIKENLLLMIEMIRHFNCSFKTFFQTNANRFSFLGIFQYNER